jgi:pimeloyl-ACP methyl ester carboxylesterase
MANREREQTTRFIDARAAIMRERLLRIARRRQCASQADLVQQRMRQLQANHAPSYAAAYTVFSTSDLGDRLHAIRVPTLIATGEHDVGSNTRMAQFMRAQIHGSRLEILSGLRHSILVEAPDLVSRLVRDFLQD